MTTTDFINDCTKCIDMCKKEYSSEFTDWIEKLMLTEIAGDSAAKNDVEDKTIVSKELSIKKIKKEIIEKLVSNYRVLDYLLQYFREHNEDYNISNICRDFIFDYDTGKNQGTFIAVEVAEHEIPHFATDPSKKYIVSIKLGLTYNENLDELASLIKNIVSELYPNREKLSDVPFYAKVYGYDGNEYKELNRLITFEIEE